MHRNPVQALSTFILAIQALQKAQNQYLTNPSKRPQLLPHLREAAIEADKASETYHRRNLKGNDNPTEHDHMGAILWRYYNQARQAYRAYKIQRNRTTKIALRDAEMDLKQHLKALTQHLENQSAST